MRICKDCCFFKKYNKEYGKCSLAPRLKLIENGHLYTLCIYSSTPACGRFKKMKNLNCETCIFANHNYPLYSYEYECHRFPPKNITGSDYVVKTLYPMVKATDWCGEYKKEN